MPTGKTLPQINAPSSGPQGKTVLLVDDEPLVRKTLKRFLELKGFLVLEADSGLEALEIAKECKDQIHLLLSDIMMPDMSGLSLARALQDLLPALKVLLISGFPANADVSQSSIAGFLQKPFTFVEFNNLIDEILSPE